jgi:hypothetical protein
VYLATKILWQGNESTLWTYDNSFNLKPKGLSNRKVADALGIPHNAMNTYVHAFIDHELSYK